MTVYANTSTKQGSFTGPINGAAQDDNIKASLDLAHTDLDAIIAAVGGGVDAAGTPLVVSSVVTSSSIPNNTQTAGAITGAASGDLLLTEICLSQDATGLAGPTNLEFSTDNVKGATGAGAPIFLEAIAALGANTSESKKDATSHTLPLQIESGKKIFIHGDDGAGTGGGVTDITFVFERITQDATIAGVTL